MLKVLQFQPKEKQQEEQAPQVNEALCAMLADLYQMATTGALRSIAVVGTAANRETVMAYTTDPNNADIFRLIGLMSACKLRMMDEGVDFGVEEGWAVLTLYDETLEQRMQAVQRETLLLIVRTQYQLHKHLWPTT